jgi:beta-lactam-binding protein with PASTA domain
MPNVVGYSYRQAAAILYTRGLILGRIKYVPGIAPKMVQKQKINGEAVVEGDTVVKGSKIDLEVGGGPGTDKVLVPYLLSLTVEEARIRLNEAFLNLGGDIPDNTVVTEDDRKIALIFRQKPDIENKARLPMGSVVDVWITTDSTKLPGYDSLNLIDQSLFAP